MCLIVFVAAAQPQGIILRYNSVQFWGHIGVVAFVGKWIWIGSDRRTRDRYLSFSCEESSCSSL